ncbi:hypothetical protein ST9NA_075 [Salmonella phage 9NA]|uniref:Uncharacterized protein n=1 Tax=Salmonella phage 9NA TaxID=1113547 RepID=A0A060D1N7_9CAUD|nr:hypothetical protein ST9NA_075 [Salmonella phage 9NA]AIB07078.1 hypothetical protein 9NA_075 [Salmonella phage 9NA]
MKPHYRLMKLSDCTNGTRFYFYRSKKLLPYTLIANSYKKFESIYHSGHEFNIMAKKFRTSIHKQVWAKVG